LFEKKREGWSFGAGKFVQCQKVGVKRAICCYRILTIMLNMVNEITVNAFCHEVKFIHLVKGVITACVAASLLGHLPSPPHVNRE
jgi:hypothetical protein